MGFAVGLSHENDAEQTKETDSYCTCLSAMLESSGLTLCASSRHAQDQSSVAAVCFQAH